MKKRIITFLTAVTVACTSMATTAYAHEDDVFPGKYSDLTKGNFFCESP